MTDFSRVIGLGPLNILEVIKINPRDDEGDTKVRTLSLVLEIARFIIELIGLLVR